MIRVVRVLAPNPGLYTLEGTNTWIVGRGPTIVIDPGPDDPGHLDEVSKEAGRIAAVLLTHDHEDHAAGGPALAERAGAPLLAFRPPPGGESIRDGQAVSAGRVILTAHHTPGHSPDSVSLFVVDGGLLFTGDSVLGRGTSVIDPPHGDLAPYLRSLARMRDLRPRTIYPGHGPVVFNAVSKLDEYLAHRQEREEQVLAALGADGAAPRRPHELVPEIYGDYPQDVYALAARSVLAHLLKLEAEGRVERSGKASDPRFAAATPRQCRRCGRRVRGRATLCGPCSLAVLQERA